jgi:aminoglycoside phosphotransferase (APT) family kinase protein
VARWFHGDVAQGNLLVIDGELAAVIDFGTCGVGDPACDLAVAWTLLTAAGRQAFRDRLSVDDATWTRGRGWALWKTLATCSYALADVDEDAATRGVPSAKSSPTTQPAAGPPRRSWSRYRRRGRSPTSRRRVLRLNCCFLTAVTVIAGP